MHVGPFTTRICEECNATIGHALGMAKFLIGLREKAMGAAADASTGTESKE